MAAKPKKSSFHSCNILDASDQPWRFWQFFRKDNRIAAGAQQLVGPGQALAPGFIAKDWRTLWQNKLNVAWLPAESVFLRVAEFPAAESDELLAMVELQMEKLSPLPVGQIVWGIEPLPSPPEGPQTVIVIICARSAVEKFLGQLETDGFYTDRIELPLVHQLLATKAEGDGVWIYPTVESSQFLCLVAWWTGGILRQLQLFHLPVSGSAGELLVEQLNETAWAGEVEGWLSGLPQVHLRADEGTVPEFEPALRKWADAVAVEPALPKAALAELSAQRALQGRSNANLLPLEFAQRYRQQFVDRLWMNSLSAVLAVYVMGVLIYMGIVQVSKFQQNRVERQVKAISNTYTNAIRLKERVDVLQNQLDLKYAALDSLRVAAEHLPAEMTLQRFTFSRGRELLLEGSAPVGQDTAITDYNDKLRRAVANDRQLFSAVENPKWDTRGGQTINWRFKADINRGE